MMAMKANYRKRRNNGFTLVEAALSVAIVGVLLVASSGTFGSIARARKSQVESRLAYLLGQQLMAEIMQCYFQQQAPTPVFGPAAGQTRSQFNYVDAYNGYAASPPTDNSGNVLSDYAGWSESVAVNYVIPTSLISTGSISTTTTLKGVTVTVTSPSGKKYVLTGYRSQYGAYEVQPSTLTNLITGVAVTVKGPAPGLSVYTGAHPLNIATSQ